MPELFQNWSISGNTFDLLQNSKDSSTNKMPKPNNKQQIEDVDDNHGNQQPPTLEFRQHRKTLRQCLILYGDFECLNEKLVVGEQPDGSYTHKLEHHTPCGFALQPVFQCCTNSETVLKLQLCIEVPPLLKHF